MRVAMENLLVFGICVHEVDEQGNAKTIDIYDKVESV